MINKTIAASEIRPGYEILYGLFGDAEPITLLICSVGESVDSVSGWYDEDKADTLDGLVGERIAVVATTIDGKSEHYLLLNANEPIAVIGQGFVSKAREKPRYQNRS